MTEEMVIQNPYPYGPPIDHYQTALSVFVESLGKTPIASVFLVLYLAAIGVAVWKGWPLRVGILMLVLGLPPLAWLLEQTEFSPLACLYGVLAIPLVLIIFGSVTASGRAIRQFIRDRKRGFHSFE